MMFPLRIPILLFLASVGSAAAQTNTCQVPDQMKKDQKLPCVRAGSFMVEQPAFFRGATIQRSGFQCSRAREKLLRILHSSGQRLVLFPPALCLHECQGR